MSKEKVHWIDRIVTRVIGGIILSLMISMMVFATSLPGRVFDSKAQKDAVVNVAKDETVHHTYKELKDEFMPKDETERRFDEINKKLDILIERAMK